jgi:hypothetical protein
MKTGSRLLLGLLGAAILLLTLIHPLQKVSADGEQSWGEFLNPDGSINWANLTYLGETSQPADWMNVEIPGGIQVPLGEARYNRYTTPSGNVVVLPSPATMFMTFLHPAASGFSSNIPEMLTSGSQVLAALTTDYIDLKDLHALGYVDPNEFFQAVIDGRENIWSVVRPNFLIEIARMSLNSGYLVTGLWLYQKGGNCDAIPGGCPAESSLIPTPGPGGTSTPPTPTGCPGASIASDDISASARKVAPLYPVVVGQDPEARGADVQLNVTIPPVVFTWYEAREYAFCAYESGGTGGGCPGPGSRYERVAGADGRNTPWLASMGSNGNWDASTETECIQHQDLFADALNSASLSINLSQGSRSWILTDLAQAYPGAHLKRPDWSFAFYGPGSVDGGKVVFFSQLIPHIQLADPGIYQIQVSGRTSGTIVSPPRRFDLPMSEFRVDLMRETLIEAP